MNASKWISLGQNAHSEKEYDRAITCYGKALDSSRLHSDVDKIHILDLRIATHVKKKELVLALKDAKAMIHLNRLDSRGYLRCGQIMRRLEDYDAAVNWYRQGLRHVPSDDKSYNVLQEQLQKLMQIKTQKLLVSKPWDPLLVLPVEILALILEYLSYRDIVRLLPVSKLWRKTLTQMSPLSDTIDLRYYKRRPTSSAIRAAIRRLRRDPREARLPTLEPERFQIIKPYLITWMGKGSLECLDVANLPAFNIGSAIVRKRKNHPELYTEVQANITLLANLKKLKISDEKIDPWMVGKIISTSTLLEEVDFGNVEYLYDDRACLLEGNVSHENQHLHTIRLKADAKARSPLLMVFVEIEALTRFPSLTTLCLRNVQLFPTQVVGDDPLDDFPCEDSFVDLSFLTKLQHLELECYWTQNVIYPPSLVHLRFQNLYIEQREDSEPQGFQYFPALCSLHALHHSNSTTPADNPPLLTNPLIHFHLPGQQSSLTDLQLGENDLNLENWKLIFERKACCLKNVKVFHYQYVDINHEFARLASQHFPQLMFVQLVGLQGTAGGWFLRSLLANPQNRIRRIVLVNSDTEGFLDVIQSVRSKGIEVAIKKIKSTGTSNGAHGW